MLRSNRDKQQHFELVSIEDLVPADHMLRKKMYMILCHTSLA